ncbi:MAG TPA: exonuclease subunit SbcD [Holophaga sp.]|nr:exonuclease subunit SbcD [Holophaga sp.]HPS67427.1 exonuclease subunit SbcD [Holophaga sp.]
MRILHTADWHLGATLEECPREADHRHFLGWLRDALVAEEVDLLIVAGDVFDAPAPSAEAQSLYYRFLHGLAGTPLRQMIVVGGNHDSASRLDAPRDLLAAFGVHVVGGVEEPPGRHLFPVTDGAGQVRAVVAAVPFVNEWRLGFRGREGSDEAQQEALGAPFRAFYRALADQACRRWPGVPLLATGHLAAAGSDRTDAPQEIHLVGTLGGLPATIFDARYAYVALGHIHRAHQVDGTRAWYSGSPIALNVKEGRSPRTVNLVDLAPDGSVEVLRLPIPGTRQVVECAGSFEEVKLRLARMSWDEGLPPLVKVDLEVEAYTVGLEEECRRFVEGLEPAPVLVGIVQTQARRPQAEGAPAPSRLADLEPREVFRMLCGARGEDYDGLRDAFEALLAEEGRA